MRIFIHLGGSINIHKNNTQKNKMKNLNQDLIKWKNTMINKKVNVHSHAHKVYSIIFHTTFTYCSPIYMRSLTTISCEMKKF